MGSCCACALPGPCQRSRSLAQTKRIVDSGDENDRLQKWARYHAGLLTTSNFIGPWYHAALLFSGLGSIVLLFVLLFSQQIRGDLVRAAYRPKWVAIALARYLAPARGSQGRLWGHSGKMSARALTRSRHFRGRAQAERLDSRETIREKMVAIQKFLSYVFISRR